MTAINQYGFESYEDFAIILSETCYEKLIEKVNLCAYQPGINSKEFGTLLYGKIVSEGNKPAIYFETPSEFDNNETKKAKWNPSDQMVDEMIENALKEDSVYNCIAHVHSHPYIDKVGRLFSAYDINNLKQIYKYVDIIAEANNRNVYKLGGLLTISPSYTAQSDDISFIYFDDDNKKIVNMPNIKIEKDGELIELPKEYDQIGLEDSTTCIFRTLLGNKSRKPKGKTYTLKK